MDEGIGEGIGDGIGADMAPPVECPKGNEPVQIPGNKNYRGRGLCGPDSQQSGQDQQQK
jgi:hypothetical protein